MLDTLDALCAEQWLSAHPNAPTEQARAIKTRLLEVFYTDTDAWREKVLLQAREALGQAVAGLSGHAR